MYRQQVFAVDDIESIHALIERRGVAQVISLCEGQLHASMLPLLLDRDRGPLGTLVGHFARANPQWRTFDPSVDTLAVFTGPDAYVSPGFYASKVETGKVVPTWNYVTIHAHGTMTVHDDAAFVEGVVRRLTSHHETGRTDPWSVDDAPADYVAAMVRGIVGVEIEITRVEATEKLSQNRPAQDIAGVITGLADGTALDREVGAEMSLRRPSAS